MVRNLFRNVLFFSHILTIGNHCACVNCYSAQSATQSGEFIPVDKYLPYNRMVAQGHKTFGFAYMVPGLTVDGSYNHNFINFCMHVRPVANYDGGQKTEAKLFQYGHNNVVQELAVAL